MVRRTLIGGLLFVTMILMVSCVSNPNNPHDDWVLVSEDMEKSMGDSAAKQIEEQVGLYESEPLNRYVSNVGNRIAIYSERPGLDYSFGIIDIFQVNALALPGGHIYVTRGLLREMESEAELAGVLAHEIAHVAAYHSVKQQQLGILSMVSAAAVAAGTGGRGLGESLMAQQMITRGYTRTAEAEADRLGFRYAARAGYDPEGLVDFLRTLQNLHGEIPQRDLVFMRTHPFLEDRIRSAQNDMEQYRSLISDTPLVERVRYQRHKRRYLFQPEEKEFLNTFNNYFVAYRNKNINRMRDLTSPEFRLGDEDSGDTRGAFLGELEKRMRRSRKIEYDKRLLSLDVGDTDTVALYEYNSRLWGYDSSTPTIQSGLQEMVWRREDDRWILTRLR
jgi:predicted Zn-dependent protease